MQIKNNRVDIFQMSSSTLGASIIIWLIPKQDHLVKFYKVFGKKYQSRSIRKNLTELRSQPDAVARISGSSGNPSSRSTSKQRWKCYDYRA